VKEGFIEEAKVIGKKKTASSRKRKFNRRGDFSKRETPKK
jgi:hypothetical protein